MDEWHLHHRAARPIPRVRVSRHLSHRSSPGPSPSQGIIGGVRDTRPPAASKDGVHLHARAGPAGAGAPGAAGATGPTAGPAGAGKADTRAAWIAGTFAYPRRRWCLPVHRMPASVRSRYRPYGPGTDRCQGGQHDRRAACRRTELGGSWMAVRVWGRTSRDVPVPDDPAPRAHAHTPHTFKIAW